MYMSPKSLQEQSLQARWLQTPTFERIANLNED